MSLLGDNHTWQQGQRQAATPRTRNRAAPRILRRLTVASPTRRDSAQTCVLRGRYSVGNKNKQILGAYLLPVRPHLNSSVTLLIKPRKREKKLLQT